MFVSCYRFTWQFYSINYTKLKRYRKLILLSPFTGLPSISNFKLPITLRENQATFDLELLECTADLGYPYNYEADVRIEVRLAGSMEFEKFTLKAPETPEMSEGECQLNSTVKYRRIEFPSAYNDSTFRCSVYENQTSTTPLVTSEEKTILLLPGAWFYFYFYAIIIILIRQPRYLYLVLSKIILQVK